MPKTNYYDTGELVTTTGIYSTFCDNALASLTSGGTFPPCPVCHLAASWRPTNLSASSGATGK